MSTLVAEPPAAERICETPRVVAGRGSRDPVLRIALTPDLYRRQVTRAVATMRAWASEEADF